MTSVKHLIEIQFGFSTNCTFIYQKSYYFFFFLVGLVGLIGLMFLLFVAILLYKALTFALVVVAILSPYVAHRRCVCVTDPLNVHL